MRRCDTHTSTVSVLIVLTVALAASSTALADTIVMKNGNKFEGKILRETAEKVVLQMDFGTMDFQRSQIKEIRKGEPKKVSQKTIEAKLFLESVLTGEQLAPSAADAWAAAECDEAAVASAADGTWHDVPTVQGRTTYDR